MAIVRIKLSQDVVDKEHALAADAPVLGGDPGSLVDFFAGAIGSIEEDYAQFSSWTMLNSTLTTGYADGAVGIYSGLVLDNPTALRGRVSATGFEFRKPNAFEVGVTGRMVYNYDISGNALSFEPAPEGLTINSLRVATKLPSTSPDYDPIFGNVSMTMSGAVTALPTGELRGSINRIDIGADKLIRSASVEGDFSLGTSLVNGQPSPSFGGTLKTFSTNYQDGSLISVTNAAISLQAGEALEDAVLRGSAGNDDISIELPGRVYEDVVVAAGAGNDLISLKGGGGRLRVDAGDGNDVISLLGDRQVVDGGRGIDTVKLAGVQADYTIKRDAGSATGFSLTDKSGAVSTLVNVERLVIGNTSVALDVDGSAGQAYRLYKAVFNRTPDAGGLGYWISTLDQGNSLKEVAAGFMTTAEFKTTYGSSQSNLELVTRFYQNILGRDPEPAGRNYWVDLLDHKVSTVAEVLANISESAENKIGLASIIGNGFTYTPWGGS